MLRRLLSLAVLGLTLAGTTVVAQAETVTVLDKRGDMWEGTGPIVRAPQEKRGDVRRTSITHAERALLIRMRFVELQPKTPMYIFAVDLRTNTGLHRSVGLFAGRLRGLGGPKGRTHFYRRNGQDADCAITHNVDWRNNTLRIRVPRSCLEASRWVQASASSHVIAGSEATRTFDDHAHNDRLRDWTWTKRVHHGDAG